MSFPKKHHFVPEVLLKRFVDSNGWLHAFSKRDPEQKVRRARPTNVFYSKHLYSTEERAGEKDPALEKELARLEGEIEGILAKFEEAAKRDRCPSLSPDERLTWHYFFALQFKRVPDFLHRPELVIKATTNFHDILDQVRTRFPDRSDEIESLAGEASRFVRNAQIGALGSVSKEVIDVLEERGIALLKLTDDRKAFIIGSRPMVQFAFVGGKTLRDAPTEMWLPISSQLLAGVGHSGEKEQLLHLKDHAAVRRLNVAIAEQSSQFASCSSTLTKSLASSRG